MAKKKKRKALVELRLTVMDRITLPMMFPQQASRDDMLMVRDLRNRVKLSKDERNEVRMREFGDRIIWGPQDETEKKQGVKQDIERVFEFAPSEIRFLKRQIERLDKEGQVTEAVLDVMDKIDSVTRAADKEEDAEDYDAADDVVDDEGEED